MLRILSFLSSRSHRAFAIGDRLVLTGRGGLSIPLLILAPKPALPLHHLLEANARVEHDERQTRHDDHDPLEPDEQVLPLHDRARPPFAQLCYTEHAPPEDAYGRQGQRGQEPLEEPRVAHPAHGLVLVERAGAELTVPPEGVDGEVDRAGHEADEGHHLEGQARDHDVVACVDAFVVVRGNRGHGAAGCLEDQRDNVTGDELLNNGKFPC